MLDLTGLQKLKSNEDSKEIEEQGQERYRKIEKDKQVECRHENLLKLMADNIKKSERLRVELNKGIANGEDPLELLDKAILTISLMTGDKTFYKQNSKKIAEYK